MAQQCLQVASAAPTAETYVAALPLSLLHSTVPCLLYHSKNINVASYHGFTAGTLHGTGDLHRQHSNVLPLCHRWRIFYWFLCLIPEAMCFIRHHLKLLAFESTKALFMKSSSVKWVLKPSASWSCSLCSWSTIARLM